LAATYDNTAVVADRVAVLEQPRAAGPLGLSLCGDVRIPAIVVTQSGRS
jgi:hypothetical protein